ncbi:uncharacterized protein [Drosophila pseudoobscura]|uniref:Uncharacterized protein isoform X1 n=2 Tax=Drosophila pseudoobscura pseudoobscura TaxID=46245 RepID=A0A0R3P8Y4_DROPS|nr:uncharacterized protein LOC4812064 isoform X1 [Drosophila pseudoobscura]
MTSPISTAVQRRRQLLHSVESLRGRVRQVLKCVINLHIEFLVLESNVAALLDEVRALNDDHEEMLRLDKLIETLRDYSGPTICHEWPYPLIFKGTIDEAHVAQILNGSELEVASSGKDYIQLESGTGASVTTSKRSRFLRFPRGSSRKLQSAD